MSSQYWAKILKRDSMAIVRTEGESSERRAYWEEERKRVSESREKRGEEKKKE